MRNLLSLPVFMALLMISGCSISKLDTASNDSNDDNVSAKKRAYSVDEKDNISRVSFIGNPGGEADVEIKFARTTNSNVPRNIRFDGSSGFSENTANFKGFRDVEFPFTGTVDYTIKPRLSQNKISSTKSGNRNINESRDLRCKLTFTINSYGAWVVKVSN